MLGDDIDFVSDLNSGNDDTSGVVLSDPSAVPAHGKDAIPVDGGKPIEAAAQPKKVVDAPAADKTAKTSLRDQISSALKGETDTPAAAAQDGKVRNADGTFAPKPAADAAGVVIPPVVAPAASAIAAPAGIDPTVFQSLPAETQATLARTMEDLSARQTKYQRLEQVEQIIAPRRDAWNMNGITETQALTQLLALSDFAGRDPAGFIKYIAHNNGVDLEQLVLTAEPVDPKYAALEKQIAELQGHRTQDTQRQQQAAHKQTVNSVAAFASEKGQDGNRLRPHFEELGNDVMPFISAVKAQNPSWSHTQILQEAYDRACWGSPSVRGKMQAAADAVASAERLRLSTEKVASARAASTSVRSGAPTGSSAGAPTGDTRSIRDTIRGAIAAAT